ncbi:MAG: CusA/CzcA family heavy metal efflux RND transporter [Candidatus Obscuribacterales bacterium]
MVDKLIAFALRQRVITLMLMAAVIALGAYSIFTLPTDSFPDVSNVQVQILTEPESMATEEVESLVTVPIEYALNGLPFIQKVRSSSEFGLSLVTAIFEDNCDVYLARQLVQQRLSTLHLPEGVPRPQLTPIVSTFSQIYMYYVESERGDMDLIDLRTLQDWTIAKRILSVPGVGNVVTYGGWIKQYKVLVEPTSLKKYSVNLKDVATALAEGNQNIGANFIEQAEEEVVIRGIGRVESVADIENIVVKEVSGTPIKIENLARVEIGPAFRRGSASMNGRGESILGIVYSRKGANTKEVVERVKTKIEQIQKTLPLGVKIRPFYNQEELVDKTTETVREILFFSGALVVIVLVAVLMDIPAALIVSLIIPLSLVFSFVLMRFTGLSLNLMTLGAVDFGVVVDAGVVMVENVYRKLAETKFTPSQRLPIIIEAAQEVGRPICFAILIIIAVYVPLFTLEGIEGKMFHPLALTFIYALLGAFVVSLTVLPVVCFFTFRRPLVERHNPVIEPIKVWYRKALTSCLRYPKIQALMAVAALCGSLCLVPFLGSEFIPSLDEGSLWLRLRMPASIAHRKTDEVVSAIERLMIEFPEVMIAATRVGRSGMGSDVEGVDAADMFIGLKPRNTWQNHNKEHLVDRMAAEIGKVPGLMYSFSQPIADVVDDLITGIKADVGIKIFGDDLDEIEQLANDVRRTVGTVRGAGDVSREPILGLPQLKIKLNRDSLSRYGLRSSEVFDHVQTAMAGKVVSEVVEGNKRFGILLQFPHESRQTAEQIRQMRIDTGDGAHVPLKALADVTVERGAVLINREDGQRRAAVMVNVRGRDLGGWVQEAQAAVAQKVKVPKGCWIVWGGQFENQQRAMTRLAIVVPIVLFLIFVLLFFTFNSVKNAALIMLNVPFAAIGGITALWLTHQPLSVPAIIGFIALFGVAVQNGVILVSYIMQLQRAGTPLDQSILQGAVIRLRPVLMTALVAMMGLIPKLFSDGTGAEIQRPLATVVFGGLISATLLTLFVIPSMYRVINRNLVKRPPPEDYDHAGGLASEAGSSDSPPGGDAPISCSR